MIVAATLLLPVLAQAAAHAQAATRAASQDSAPTLQAKASPVVFRPSATPAPAPAPIARIVRRPIFTDVIKTRLNRDVEDFADQQSGTLAFRLGEDTQSTAPRLLHIVDRELPANLVNERTSPVAVRMVVDPHGVPSSLTVVRSAGPVVDRQTLAAVSQYRFEPATMNHQPVSSDITVEVDLTTEAR
jgi:TonB family protein